ncbi:binder of sperm protein homolog 2 isoform X1 [Sarcophilus harrisii]|uniref:Fibronectin type-II domain-containing protein n=1 Tax=Sarcophilus harrisii TaxID=9305 RepID=G3VIB3_SARHA|nr:binder of sperm protein homolog 2 isoform X1 [Sarcophilus harrisii]
MIPEKGLLGAWVCLLFCLPGANAELTRYRRIRPLPEKVLKPCAFPFVYEDVSYDRCIMVHSDYAWCSVESNFNGQWRYCISTDPPACKFPFVFGRKLYHDCTRDGYVLGRTWCALTHNYNLNGLWKPCSPNDL